MIFALAMGLILLFIFMGVSIPLSFLSGSFFLAIFAGARTGSFATNAYYMLDSIAMLAIPLFVVGGQLVEKSGIANVLIEVGDRLLRKVKGGMAAAIPVVSCFFGAMCGSALATANTLATAMAPDMVKKGWDKRYVAALIAASSPMGFYDTAQCECDRLFDRGLGRLCGRALHVHNHSRHHLDGAISADQPPHLHAVLRSYQTQ